MDQTGSARSYPTSTTARCGEERKAQGPETGSWVWGRVGTRAWISFVGQVRRRLFKVHPTAL
eukprot:134510-Chlamydomonas_euryale.AAC.1